MKKLLSVLIIMLLVPTLVFAKSYEDIVVGYSDNDSEDVHNVVGTSDGGYAVVGFYSNSSSFIAKYDKNDKIEWTYITDYYEYFYDIEETSDGGLIVAGMLVPVGSKLYDGEVDAGGPQYALIKLDMTGKKEWISLHEFPGFAFLRDVEEGKNGNFYAVGYATDGAEGQEGYVDGNSLAAIYVVDKNGKELNYQEFDGLGEESFEGVLPLDDGGFMLVGHTNSPEFMNIPELIEDQYVPIIAKFDKNYKLEWAKNYELADGVGTAYCSTNTYDEVPYSTFYDIVAADDGVYVAGKKNIFSDNNVLSTDGIVVKYDLKGNIVWEYSEASPYRDSFRDITVTKTGKILVAGYKGFYLEPTGDDEGMLSYTHVCWDGGRALYIAVLDKNGKKINERKFDDASDDYFYAIDLMSDGSLIAAGGFSSANLKELELKDEYDGIIYHIKVDFVITKEKTENGTFEAVENPENEKGIVTLEPDEGYEIGEVKVVDSNGDEVVVTKESDGSYTYDIYDDTWVTVTFEKIPESPKTGIESYLVLGVILSFIAVIVYKFSKEKDAFRQI